MSKGQILALSAIAALAVLVAVLALRNRQPPLLPVDEDHRGFAGAEACLVCHGPDGGHYKGDNHPIGDDCTRCHGRP